MLYIFLWIFTWTIFSSLREHYKLTNKDTLMMSVGGFFCIVIFLQCNPQIDFS